MFFITVAKQKKKQKKKFGVDCYINEPINRQKEIHIRMQYKHFIGYSLGWRRKCGT